MKNLKKLLALMLVLVLALGMVPYAGANSAAIANVYDFTDAANIEDDYVEAVDVLAALGVYVGEGPEGARAFNPKDTFTRAQAAAIMARIILGAETASRLPLAATGFSDVPAGHWAAGYIGYGVDREIILGYGDGTYGPDNPVTALQMARLLLGAIGYGTQGELQGPGWEIRTIERATHRDVRVLWGTGEPDYTAPATREEVAQYTFMALHWPNMVSWNSVINDYSHWSNVIQQTGQRPSLGGSTFGLASVSSRDGYGLRGREWAINNGRNLITGYYQTDDIIGTSTSGTPIDTTSGTSRSLTVRGRQGFIAEIGGSQWNDVEDDWEPVTNSNIQIYVNGRLANGDGTASISRDQAFQLAAISGVTVHLLDAWPYDGRVDRIAIIAKTVHEVAAAPSVAPNGSVTISGVDVGVLQYLQGGGNTNGSRYWVTGGPTAVNRVVIGGDSNGGTGLSRAINARAANEIEYPNGIVAGDILLVHDKFEDGFVVTVVEKADTVTGQMTSARNLAPPNITFGGRTFNQSGLTPGMLFDIPTPDPGVQLTSRFPTYAAFASVSGAITSDANFNKDATIWLDDNGDVIFARLDDPNLPVYGLVVEYTRQLIGLSSQPQVMLATADGNVKDYIVALRSGQTLAQLETYLNEGAWTDGDPVTVRPSLVDYRILDDGRVSIVIPPAASVDTNSNARGRTLSAAYNKGTSRVTTAEGALFITGQTTVFYFDWGSGDRYDPKENPVYVGIGASAANEDVDNTTGLHYVTTATVQSSLGAVVFDQGNSALGSATYAYVTHPAFVARDTSVSPTVYTYNVWIDGVGNQQIKSTAPALFGTATGHYTFRPVTATGLVESVDIINARNNFLLDDSPWDAATPSSARIIESRQENGYGVVVYTIVDNADNDIPNPTSIRTDSFTYGPTTVWRRHIPSPPGDITVMNNQPAVIVTDPENVTGQRYTIVGVQPRVGGGDVVAIYYQLSSVEITS